MKTVSKMFQLAVLILLSACVPVTPAPTPLLTPLATPAANLFCAQPKSWKIDFQRTGGFAGWSQALSISSNGEILATDLRRDQKYTAIASSQTLQSLIGKLAEACPFEAVRPQSVCADCFEYTLSIEMDGVQYSVKATDADMSENLRPLIEELTAITQTTFPK